MAFLRNECAYAGLDQCTPWLTCLVWTVPLHSYTQWPVKQYTPLIARGVCEKQCALSIRDMSTVHMAITRVYFLTRGPLLLVHIGCNNVEEHVQRWSDKEHTPSTFHRWQHMHPSVAAWGNAQPFTADATPPRWSVSIVPELLKGI